MSLKTDPRISSPAWTAVAFCAALLLGAGLLAAPSPALVPAAQSPAADRLLPLGPEAITRDLGAGRVALSGQQQREADARLQRLAVEIGGRWSVLAWNHVTLTPRLATGSGIDLGAPISTRETAEVAARRFVDESSFLWGLPADRLVTERVASGLGKWSVHFRQMAGRYPVLGSRLTVTMTDGGRVVAFGGDLWPDLVAPGDPLLSQDDATSRARTELASLGLAPPIPQPGERTRVLNLGVLPPSRTAGYLVYRLRLNVQDPLGAWLLDVDAMTGQVHQIQHVLRTEDFSGTISGDVEIFGWCDGLSVDSLALMKVVIAGVGSDTTDADGFYDIPYPGSDPESLRIEFLGPYVDVNNAQGPDSEISEEILPGVHDFHWDDGNSRIDERDVFFHTNGIHEFLKVIDPGWSDLDFPLPANVNINAACNAYWDGESINFFKESGNCANTGRLGDVVAHEYGHGVTDYLYGDNDPPGDLHEGNSDVHGNYYTDNHVVAPGFYLDDCEGGIRDSQNDLVWPDDLTGEGHFDGQILAGFHWDIWEALQASLGEAAGQARAAEIWHFSRVLGLPMTQPEQVWWTFIADDDDGNLDNGTPSYDAICQGAQHHGFECPEVFDAVVIHHAAVPYAQAPDETPIPVEATVYSFSGEMNPDSVLVYYRERGSADPFSAAPMAPTGEDDVWQAELPGQPVGTEIEYYIFAADLAQNHLTDPRSAPDELHVTTVVTVYDPLEEDTGWTVGSPEDDATQGIWERVDPEEARLGTTIVQPEDDATPDPGALCWITGQYPGGYPWYSDADGRTTLLSPICDLSAYDWALLGYARWFQTWGSAQGMMELEVSNDGGNTWVNLEHLEGANPHPNWIRMMHNITPLFPSLGQLRFRVVMYGQVNPSVDEGGLDEFVIMAGTGSASGVEPAAAGVVTLQLGLASANPAAGGASIRFGLPREGRVVLTVLDVRGRIVRTLADGIRPAGWHTLAWEGRDAGGREVGSGIYFIRLATPMGSRTARIVRIR